MKLHFQPLVTKPKTYEIVKTNGLAWIKCLKCGQKSYHPGDIKNKYCGKCHAFHENL